MAVYVDRRRDGGVPSELLRKREIAPVGTQDDREVRRLLDPMAEVVDAFAALSRTQRSQRESEFKYQVGKLKHEAATNDSGLANATARDVLAQRAQLLVERLR